MSELKETKKIKFVALYEWTPKQFEPDLTQNPKKIPLDYIFCYMSRPKTYFEPKPHSYQSTISSFIQCQLISTLINSTSTQFQLNLDSTSSQPQPQINISLNINLNLTLTLASTQYGCDIKATQSCVNSL